MLFNSYVFVIVFLPLCLMLWWKGGFSSRDRVILITAASYLFYGWWDFRFTGLLALSTALDYFAGHMIFRATSQRRRFGWLMVSLVSNLGLLAFFKYFGFATQSFNAVMEWTQFGGRLPFWEIVLPAGISFYTFQTLSYSIDLYKGDVKPAKSLWHFAAFVSLFPQLIAGPIVRYSDVDDQLNALPKTIQWEQFGTGICFFVGGMAQKVLLADTIAARIDPLFLEFRELQFFGSWYAMLGYTCQLYFDFAGYSNMAIGLGYMLGFSFPQNFDSPYKSKSIAEFWRRWHMTLSYFLRDYLFIPLGGNRSGTRMTCRNLMIVMLLGGLWHGAAWTFVVWGAYHGLLLVIQRVFNSMTKFRIPAWLAWPVTFFAVVMGWVMFRAGSLSMCWEMYSGLFGLKGLESSPLSAIGGTTAAAILGVLLFIVWFLPNLWQMKLRLNAVTAAGLALLLFVCVLRFSQDSPFLYFQF
jgi:alginate O-acetyltransferase complex protein AlgI